MRCLFLIYVIAVVSACNNNAKKEDNKKEDSSQQVIETPPPAVADTVFTGFGTEPFWSIYVIRDSKIVFHPADGDDVEVPFVAPSTTDYTTYSSSANGASINLIIMKKECSDGMSDNVHLYEVNLAVNKTKYYGCGREGK